MEREKIRETVMAFIRDIIDDNTVEITEESSLMDDLELSSLEIMTMISDVEQEFHIVLEEEAIRKIVSVGELIECIWHKVKPDTCETEH